MWNYMIHDRQGRFLIIGTVFLILGFVAQFAGSDFSRYLFYLSIFFLGFYAAKAAVVETIEDKSPNVDLLMILAAIGAVVINYESEGAMLLLIFAASGVLEEYAMDKSTSAITELMGHVPDTAQRILPSGEIEEVATEELAVGDLVMVQKGAQVPIDGYADRQVQINEASLTGESVPVSKGAGDEVFAGTINEGNAFQLEVGKTSNETVFSNIIRMVEEAQGRPSKIASFIDRIESRYVLAVLIVVPIFIALLYFWQDYTFQDAFYRGMVLLTVASPCALVASATPATLSAISNGAKNGILVKGGAAMEALSTMDILYSDKTGTLTEGEFQVVDYSLADEYVGDVVYMEQQSTHPIAAAIVANFSDKAQGQNPSGEVEEVAGMGVKMGDMQVGKPSAFKDYNRYEEFIQAGDEANTLIFVAKGNEVVGYIELSDQVRPEAKIAVDGFKQEGVRVELLTGDNELVAGKVAKEVGVDDYAAALLPEDKIKFVQNSQAKDQVVGMIGDGINDAPALANADIGIGMGSGSSVAMESSDIVIVQNDLSKLLYSFRLSKKLNKIILQNVVFAIGVIVVLIILNLIGWLDLPMGVLFHEGSTILVILNGLRMLRQDGSLEEGTSVH